MPFWLPAGSNVMPKPWLNKEQIMRKTLVDRLEKVRDKGQHPGLLLQRYLAKPATGEMGDPDEKHRLLAAAIQAAHNSELQTLYRLAFERYYQLLSSTTQPWECKDFRTQTRLIVGLGSENVLETGITVHHTYGMPYIPGSALKGVAAHYCHRVYGAEDARFSKPEDNDDAYREYMQGIGPYPGDNYHRLLFGTNDDSGCIVFYDALLIPDRKQESLQLDVMTPHHMGWNNTSDPRAPTDFDSPTPVPYLSVRGRFRVCLSWRGPASDRAASWLAFAMKVLEEAVRLWGVGGKTSSGYGRLIPVT
ncbi:MAG: type III-B CRISPR module RAMP protein Cmr6 [Gemmataceae bacterium]